VNLGRHFDFSPFTSSLAQKIPNVQVSDTTGDAMKNQTPGKKNIKTKL
jgi:hypothetical protein